MNVFKTQASGSFGGAGSGVASTLELTWEYPKGLPVNSSCVIWYTINYGKLYVTGSNGVEKEVTIDNDALVNSVEVASLVGSRLTKIRVEAADTTWKYLYGLFIDGDQIIDGVNPDVKVVSTDPDNNTMVVDGGTWKTSGQQSV